MEFEGELTFSQILLIVAFVGAVLYGAPLIWTQVMG